MPATGLRPSGTLVLRECRGAGRNSMQLNIVNPNTTAAMTAIIAAAAAKAARPDTVIRAVSPLSDHASIEGAYDDAFAVPGLLERIKEGEAAGRRRARHRLLRRYRARCGACACERAGGRHRRGRLSRRRDARASLRGRHDAVALGAGAREQPVALRARPPLRARARDRRGGARARQSGLECARARSAPRSPARSTRTAPRRSCSAAPAWRILRPRSRPSSACR